jgi:hypothetical protein
MRFAGSVTRPLAYIRNPSYVLGFSVFMTYILRAFPLKYVAASLIFLRLSPPIAVKYVLHIAAYSRYSRRLFPSYVVGSLALIYTRFVCETVDELIDKLRL